MDTNTTAVAAKEYSVHQARKGHLLVTLPSVWVRTLGLKKADKIRAEILSDGSLRIIPLKDNQNGVGVVISRAPPPRSEAPSNSDPESSTSDLTKEGTSDE